MSRDKTKYSVEEVQFLADLGTEFREAVRSYAAIAGKEEVLRVLKEFTRPSIEDVRKALRTYAAIESKEVAIELVKEFVPIRLGYVEPENYEKIIAKIEAELNAPRKK